MVGLTTWSRLGLTPVMENENIENTGYDNRAYCVPRETWEERCDWDACF